MFMSFLSAAMLAGMVYGGYIDGRFSSLETAICTRLQPVQPGLVHFSMYVFYLSKMLEFVDTFLLVLSKKKLIWLHKIHHLTTMSLVWHCMHAHIPGEIVCSGLNCFVHIIMYFYFAKPVRQLRSLITTTQITQFLIVLATLGYAHWVRFNRSTPCQGTYVGELHGLGIYSVYLFMFVNFFVQQYLKAHCKDTKVKKPRHPGYVAVGGELLMFPPEMFQPDAMAATQMLAKTLVMGGGGVLCLAYLPDIVGLPVGVVMMSCCMSGLYLVGRDCSCTHFFEKEWLNRVVGSLALMPLLRPFTTQDASMLVHGNWLNRLAKRFFGLSKSHLVLYAFVGLVVPLVVGRVGWSGLVRYWLIPFVAMHLNLGSFSAKVTKPTYSILFPQLAFLSPLLSSFGLAHGEGTTADSKHTATASARRRGGKRQPDPANVPVLDLTKVPLYKLAPATKILAQHIDDQTWGAAAAAAAAAAAEQGKGVWRLAENIWNASGVPHYAQSMLMWKHRDIALHLCTSAFALMLFLSHRSANFTLHRAVVLAPFAVLFFLAKQQSNLAARQQEWAVRAGVRSRISVGGSLSSCARSVAKHLQQGDVNWPMAVFLTAMHTLAVMGLLAMNDCQPATLLWAFVLWPVSGLGITCGAHRLFSHRSFSASLPLRAVLVLLNCVANQGSLLHWVRDHRVHHKCSETPADPHDATRGFFFAHMGWLLLKKDKRVIEEGKRMAARGEFADLEQDALVMLQHKLDPWINLFFCFLVPAYVATLWGETWWLGFLTAGCLRYVAVLHFTWLVNSAAHLWGDHPYDETIHPAENPWVSIAAIGEGWHNWHHKFPYDYAASELGVSDQYNPTKLFIDACCKIGLASNRKRATAAWNRVKQKQHQLHEAHFSHAKNHSD
mmetsp:Transcript_12564/g.24160  ORF Transcript_12564/g.24160 Transcript_12564/m.24160 type:complete len:889 (-) Transcript_12564:363-3029(-)